MTQPVREIAAVAEDLGLDPHEYVQTGRAKAKLALSAIGPVGPRPEFGRLVLVTAITPGASGEGKTVTSIGLAMGLRRLGRRTAVTLRQSSLGPTLGRKGGGAGGGQAGLVPLEEALLGLGADSHAVESHGYYRSKGRMPGRPGVWRVPGALEHRGAWPAELSQTGRFWPLPVCGEDASVLRPLTHAWLRAPARSDG